MELLLRICAEGVCRFFYFSDCAAWNVFDSFVVLGDVAETLVLLAGGDSGALQNLTAVRMLRVLRVLRAIRIVRLVRFCKDLRMMVYSILRCGTTIMWSLFLLVIVMFIFSIFLTQNVTNHVATQPGADTAELQRMFGSLLKSVFYLFMSISGGVSWIEIVRPLNEIHWSNGAVFCFYIFFTTFAILNIVTGIFVDTAILSATTDRDEVIQEQLLAEESSVKQLQKIFAAADSDGSGCVSLEELQEHLQDNHVRAHLTSMGLAVGEAKGIFNLLDLDKSGSVTIEEFVFGLMRIKGAAKAVDTATLMYENKRMMQLWGQFMAVAEDVWLQTQAFEQRIDGQLTELFKVVRGK